MIIIPTVHNEQLFEKILWLLKCFKNDGVNIVTNREKSVENFKFLGSGHKPQIIQTPKHMRN